VLLFKIMRSRAIVLVTALGAGLALGVVGPVSAGASTRSALPKAAAATAPRTARPQISAPKITWQNVNNARYLEVYHSTLARGANVDAYPGNGTATQHWYAIDDGVEYFGYPVGASYDAWTFQNANSGLCLQDGDTGGFVRAYVDPCAYGSQQQFAEWGGSSSYALITSWGDEVCEKWADSTDWVYTEGVGYDDWGTSLCAWH
jgi:hypothetical protein